MNHFVRSKNLPYSISKIRQMTSDCEVCLKLKPNFAQLQTGQLIKATQVFKSLNLDFKGPLPSNSHNRYFLTIVDEHSRFPFACPCADLTPISVIKCLQDLFSAFGMSAYIHSDRWSSFQSNELKTWLQSHGVATSRTTSYNPQGNGHCEKYNGTIWKAEQAALKSRNLPLTHWEVVLKDALHSIRSLLCICINCTPHERMFSHARRSVNGTTIPSWLKPGPIYVKRHVRNKHEPLVDEAELIKLNPNYAHVRMQDGRETTVSIRDLSPHQSENDSRIEPDISKTAVPEPVFEDNVNTTETANSNDSDLKPADEPDNVSHDNVTLRRSTRVRKPVDRFGIVPYV